MRRVITGHRNGKSVILDDAEIPSHDMFGNEGTMLWKTEGTPTIPVKEDECKKQIPIEFPKPGGTFLNISLFLPDKEVFKNTKEKGVDIVEVWRNTFKDDFGMHTSDTIDYDIVISGELWMELDDGVEVQLKPGDCVVQNGTRHAWRNKGSENCIMASVAVGAKRKKSTK